VSIDLFVFCRRNGKHVSFPRLTVEGAWAPFISWEDETVLELNFPDGGHSTIYLDEGPETYAMMISRPAESPGLWAGLFLILDETGCILCGLDPGNFVTREIYVPHYDGDDVFSPIIVAQSAEELRGDGD
jgi:hypothetical protein